MRIIIAVGIAMLIGLESNHVFEVLAKGREDWLWKGRLANVIKEKMEGGERHPIKPSLRQEPVDREGNFLNMLRSIMVQKQLAHDSQKYIVH